MMAFFAMLKGRLALVGLAVSLTIIAGLWFLYIHADGQRAEERAAKEIAIAANEANAETIRVLRERAERDAALLRELQGIRAEIAANADRRQADLDRLAQENEDVAGFLDIPIPDALRVQHAESDNADGNNPD